MTSVLTAQIALGFPTASRSQILGHLLLAKQRKEQLSAMDAATMFGVGIEELELMTNSHRDSPEMQSYLADVVTILLSAELAFKSMDKATDWFRTEPLKAFGSKTANELVVDGRFHDVRRMVESMVLGVGARSA